MLKQCRRLFLALFVVFLLFVPIARGKEGSPALPPEEALQALTFGESRPALSADGTWVAYTLKDPRRMSITEGHSQRFFLPTGAPSFAAGTDVWITNTDSGESRNLTGSNGANWGASWAPDGRLLAFYSDRDGHARLWIYDLKKQDIRPLCEAVVRVIDPWQMPSWSPDSTSILTKILNRENPKVKLDHGATALPASGREDPNAIVFVSRPSGKASSDVEGDTSANLVKDQTTQAEYSDLAVISVATGAVNRLAQGRAPVWYSWSPDGSHFAFADMKGFYKGEVYRGVFDLVVGSPKGKLQVIDPDIVRQSWAFSASWSPRGNQLSYVGSGGDEDGECYVVGLGGEPRRKATRSPHPPFSPLLQAPVWNSTGDRMYFVTNTYALWSISLTDGQAREIGRVPNHRVYSIVGSDDEGHLESGTSSVLVSGIDVNTQESGFYRLNLDTGAVSQLQSERKSYDLQSILSAKYSNKVVYVAETVGQSPQLLVSNRDFSKTKELTNFNPSVNQLPMGNSRLIKWRTGDGEVVQGALLLPNSYQEGRHYPLIVVIYPGLFSQCLNRFGLCGKIFFPNKQLFATRGYAVLMPDIRLTGKSLMADLSKTVLPGVNAAIDQGIADPDRIGLMGTSWGGYATLALITQTVKFKAAVVISGFGDLLGLYCEMDQGGSSLGISILEQGPFPLPGTPWNFRDIYVENSPIFYLDRVETPVLILHGKEDVNVAPSLADEVFVGLRRLGKPVTYVKYVTEEHGIELYENQMDSFNRIIDWMDLYLKAKSTEVVAREKVHAPGASLRLNQAQ
jgi:dipeptidyl aminopeptidase/acylaminoacyl peptidase